MSIGLNIKRFSVYTNYWFIRHKVECTGSTKFRAVSENCDLHIVKLWDTFYIDLRIINSVILSF